MKDQTLLSVVRSSVSAYQRTAKIPKGRQTEWKTFAVRLTHVKKKIGDKEQVKKMMELNGKQEEKISPVLHFQPPPVTIPE